MGKSEMTTIIFRQEEEPKNVIRALIWKTEALTSRRAKTVRFWFTETTVVQTVKNRIR